MLSITLLVIGCVYENGIVNPSDDTAEEVVADTGSDEAVDCGFSVYYNEVQTVPVFTETYHKEVEVKQGDSVFLNFTVSSFGGCGDMQIHEFQFVMINTSFGAGQWLRHLGESGVKSSFYDLEDTGATMWNEEGVDYEHGNPNYIWKDVKGHHSEGATMTTQDVAADEEADFSFVWSGSEYAPVGETFSLALATTDWTDVTTGTMTTDDAAVDCCDTGGPPFFYVETHVTIVE